MTVIGAYLSGLPASYREVALGDFAENFLDMVLRVPLLFMSRLKTCIAMALRRLDE